MIGRTVIQDGDSFDMEQLPAMIKELQEKGPSDVKILTHSLAWRKLVL